MKQISIGTGGASLSSVGEIRAGAGAVLSEEARAAIRTGRAAVDRHLGDSRPIYGINTGFGRLAGTVIGASELSQLQRNLLLSHACGTGRPLSKEMTRVTIYLRAASLSRGRSGIREETVDALLAFLNGPLVPVVPEKGSLGASGDLAPLAHLCLPLIGEGRCVDGSGREIGGAEALRLLGLEPLELGPKEGLALINGTPVMTAISACALCDALLLGDAADCAAALSLEALLGTRAAFETGLLDLRPHPGALTSARNIRALTAGSEIIRSHADCPRVQDAYSVRCIPQVHGASRDAMAYVRGVIEIELVSVTDNPLLAPDGEFISGGNFHGQPVALASDHLGLAAAELASISERRIERLLNPDLSGLPAFLAADPGLHSGLMIAQYTAASLVSENKVLVHPASADSIPVSGAQEDHVSMGTTAARQAAEIVGNCRRVIATELLCAAQAHEFLDRGRRGQGTEEVWRLVRSVAPRLGPDRQFSADIDGLERLISEGAFSDLLAQASKS
jgi:histidine ammonia-lyase